MLSEEEGKQYIEEATSRLLYMAVAESKYWREYTVAMWQAASLLCAASAFAVRHAAGDEAGQKVLEDMIENFGEDAREAYDRKCHETPRPPQPTPEETPNEG